MDRPWIDRPRDRVESAEGESADSREDLTADLLRLTAAMVTLVAAIVLGVVR